MKKEILWEGEYQYDLEIDDNVYTLWHNNSEYWQSDVRDTVAIEVVNTGNGFKIKGLSKKNFLDYSEAIYLYIILAYEKDYKVEIITSKKEL